MALQEHKRAKNIRTKKHFIRPLGNYESISGIPIHKREIQIIESATSVDVCFTLVSFSLTAYNTKYLEKGNEVKEIKPCIK